MSNTQVDPAPRERHLWSQPQLCESQSLSKLHPAPIARLVHTRQKHLLDSQSVFHRQAAPSSLAAEPLGGATAALEDGSALGAVVADAAGSLLGALDALAVGSLVGSADAVLLGSLVGSALTKEVPEATAFELPVL